MNHLKTEYEPIVRSARDYAKLLNRGVNIAGFFGNQMGRLWGVVNALIHLTLPCQRHIIRIRPGRTRIGRA